MMRLEKVWKILQLLWLLAQIVKNIDAVMILNNLLHFIKNKMSFFSSPSKYLQQALEARRARQREEARKRRHNAQERARHPFIGNSHANHQTGGQIQFTSKWRSMSEFIPSIFTPRDLKTDTDLPGHVHDLHGGSSSIVDSSAELKVSSVGFDDDSVRLKNDPSRETQTEQRMESQIGPPELCLVGDESLNGSTSRHRREIGTN